MDFYNSISSVYNYIFPYNPVQLKFVLNEIGKLEGEHKLLDIGCATGNLSLELLKNNIRLTGIDLDEKMIDIARSKLGVESYPSIFQVMNMLKIKDAFKCNEFDTVLCFGNTIPHVSNLQELEYLCRQVAVVTKPGGLFLLQLINYNRILNQNINSLPTIDNDQIKFERNYTLATDGRKISFDTKLTIKEDQQIIENSILLLPVKSEELVKILEKSGFEGIQLYGGFNHSEYSENSIPLVISCKKKIT
jgi:glycine/sarcosine N-methyltransferase